MNKQLVFGVIAVVFATALIASLVVDSVNAQTSNRQSISQRNHQHQDSAVVTAGTGSTVTGSGNNAATATNTNNGGNAAAF
jgi:hypothetical protein